LADGGKTLIFPKPQIVRRLAWVHESNSVVRESAGFLWVEDLFLPGQVDSNWRAIKYLTGKQPVTEVQRKINEIDLYLLLI
jgi:hypothetical protein